MDLLKEFVCLFVTFHVISPAVILNDPWSTCSQGPCHCDEVYLEVVCSSVPFTHILNQQYFPTDTETIIFIFNFITTMPHDFYEQRGLNNLKSVYLIQNPLKQLTRQSLSSIGRFNDGHLSIMLSEIMFIPPDLLHDLTELRELDMNINYFLAFIPDGFLDGLTKLETVEFSSNSIGMLPSSLLCDAENIQHLYLDDNKLSVPGIPQSTFCSASTLKKIKLDRNRLSSLLPEWFEGLTSLRSLDVNLNNIETLPDALFCDNIDLIYVNLENNLIRSAGIEREPFCQLPNLEYIRMQHNRLTYVGATWFAGLSGLKTLDLSHNNIEFLEDSSFDSLMSVDVIDLQCNSLTPAGIPDDIFIGATLLGPVVVELYGNFISHYNIPIACHTPGVFCSLAANTIC